GYRRSREAGSGSSSVEPRTSLPVDDGARPPEAAWFAAIALSAHPAGWPFRRGNELRRFSRSEGATGRHVEECRECAECMQAGSKPLLTAGEWIAAYPPGARGLRKRRGEQLFPPAFIL